LHHDEKSKKNFNKLVVGAIGVVFGDIGTSPLYAFREAFYGRNAAAVVEENILGVLSVIFWVIVFIVIFKYLTFIMRAHNDGEGGILALLALLGTRNKPKFKRTGYLIALGLFGSALLYGDGVITPAISVLSAVEGLEIAAPQLHAFVVPITIGILVALFSVQKYGTNKMGMIFGPVTLVWFFSIALGGLISIFHAPHVLIAINPYYAVNFIIKNGEHVLPVLSMVFLAITGTEALYSDMGHFGVKAIRRGWYLIVFPSLTLNYFGQGALLMVNPGAANNPFYNLYHGWLLYPMVALASMATVIASQALISGAFSITRQAVQLGYLPRLTIDHTSEEMIGQIYIPEVNTLLMLVCITLVVIFKESANLADAYGMAVVCTMMITSLLFYHVAVEQFKWGKIKAGLLLCFFLSIEIPFFAANVMKFIHGAWIPILIASLIYFIMVAWNSGRKKLYDDYHSKIIPMTDFLKDFTKTKYAHVKGTAVYMTSNTRGVPILLLHNLEHNHAIHEQVILLSIITEEIPRVPEADRYFIKQLKDGFYRIIAHYGYMEDQNIPKLIKQLPYEAEILNINMENTTFFLGSETLFIKTRRGFNFTFIKLKLFSFFSRNMVNATRYYKLPSDRVVEIGRQVIL
ncbi:MAG: potassium transporter Kup, partial [Spirochaetia bacterium]|nr:potassium transporter Kup [Spirochaetia bacterium]